MTRSRCLLGAMLFFCCATALAQQSLYRVDRGEKLVKLYRHGDPQPFAVIGRLAKTAVFSVETRPGEPFVRFEFGPAVQKTDRRLRFLPFPKIRPVGIGDPWDCVFKGRPVSRRLTDITVLSCIWRLRSRTRARASCAAGSHRSRGAAL